MEEPKSYNYKHVEEHLAKDRTLWNFTVNSKEARCSFIIHSITVIMLTDLTIEEEDNNYVTNNTHYHLQTYYVCK